MASERMRDLARIWLASHMQYVSRDLDDLYELLEEVAIERARGEITLDEMAAIQRVAEVKERARIVAWLRSYDDFHRRSALADRIERGEHLSFGTTRSGAK